MSHPDTDTAFTVSWPKPTALRLGGWMRYFLAALSIGVAPAQESMLLRYWWVYNDTLPAVKEEEPRVIRVFGEKGENFVEVDPATGMPADAERAREQRMRILREEALELARQYMEDGKPMDVAYERAWSEVYRRHWLRKDFQASSSELEEMLARIADAEDVSLLPPAEIRHALALLLGDAERMSTEQGQRMLQMLASHVKSMGIGTDGQGVGSNDEVMNLFVDALRHDYNAFTAFRDALFKSNHDRVMHHDVVGYLAPWGAGLPGRVRYHQAAPRVSQTLKSGSLNAAKPEEEDDDKKKKPQKKEEEQEAVPSANMGPLLSDSGNYRPMMFALRSTSAVAAEVADLTVHGKAALYFTGTGNKLSGNTVLKRTGKNKKDYKYSTSTHGSYDNAEWTSITNPDAKDKDKENSKARYWEGNNSVLGNFNKSGKDYVANVSNGLSSTVNLIDLGGGNELYIGGVSYTGTIRIVNADAETAWLGSYLPEGTIYNMGRLSGKGNLTLVAHGTAGQASIYSFSDAAASASTWFSGTLHMGASQGGIIELDLASSGESTAWKNVVFDMTPGAAPGHSSSTGEKAALTILNVRGDVQIAGLQGGDGNSTVTSESGDDFFNLTLGSSDADADYVYSGTFNGSYYITATRKENSSASIELIKTGANQQTFTNDVTSDSNRLYSVTVEGGELRFDDDDDDDDTTSFSDEIYTKSLMVRYATVRDTGDLRAKNISVFGEQLDTPSFNITGGRVHVNDTITVSTNLTTPDDAFASGSMGVSGGASVEATDVFVSKQLDVAGSGTRMEVSDMLQAGSLKVSDGAYVSAGHVQVANWLEIGLEGAGASFDETHRPTLFCSGDLTADELRLRANGRLITGNSATMLSKSFITGGAVWEMSGTRNYLQDQLSLSGVGGTGDAMVHLEGTSAVKGETILTLSKRIDVNASDWSDAGQALFELNGVTLDFCEDVIISGLNFSLQEGSIITLASTATEKGGWFMDSSYTDTSVASVRFNQGGYLWHGLLGYDGSGNIIATIQHKTEQPCIVEKGNLVYIEMRQNATAPALPHLAYESASWSNGWSGQEIAPAELLKFGNVTLASGADLYLGEDLTVVYDPADPSKVLIDYRPDRNFGGNITISGGSEAAYLHGQIGDWGKWTLYGHLGGDGELVLVSHNGRADQVNDNNLASSFIFTSVTNPEDWFSGTLKIDDPTGGVVQLHVGNVNIAANGDTRWKNTVIDLSHTGMQDAATGAEDTRAYSTHVLAVEGNTTLRGLHGTDQNAMVVSSRPATSSQSSFVLTLGDADAGAHYIYEGVIGKGDYYLGGAATSNTLEGGAVQQTNFYTTRTGSLSLTKTGANTQEFAGSAYLDNVVVQGGKLIFSGNTTEIESLTIHRNAKVISNGMALGKITLYGGAAWETTAARPDTYDTPVYIKDVYGADGTTTAITIDSNGATWIPAMYLNMADAGVWNDASTAVFSLTADTRLDLSKPRVITNMSGITGGCEIALYSGVQQGQYTFLDDMVMVEDTLGNFYDADYEWRDGTIYLVLSDARTYGIEALEGYIWSGEPNGTTIGNNVHYINMTMGNVWRADGSAYNTGWHEQRAEGSSNDDIGVYVNGETVHFRDYNVHFYDDGLSKDKLTAAEQKAYAQNGTYATERRVDISGNVAPGDIFIDADFNLGTVGASGNESQMEYAYAFVSSDKTGCITDIDEEHLTSITKTGKGLLVLAQRNTFSGGIDVQDGGLYLAAVGAAGTGTLTFHTDEVWSQTVVGQDKNLSVNQERTGAELMICYAFNSDALSAFRGSSLANDIVLTSSKDTAGAFTVSFAYAGYDIQSNGDDYSNLPRHWRNLTLSGALVGTGNREDKLVLTGYSSTWQGAHDQSYVTVVTLNEDTAGDAYKYEINPITGKEEIVNRFNGTVELHNTINTSPLPSNELGSRTAGTVQIVLKGDKLCEAEFDMTRESVLSEYDKRTENEGDYRQTYNNILVLNGDASLRGLSADFHGSGWNYKEKDSIVWDDMTDRNFVHDLPQNDEVWHVRVLTAGENTLRLGAASDTEEACYVYSGAMGFEQAYVGTSQGHIPWGDGFFEQDNPEWRYGGHEMGTASLSMVKSGAATQLIHTALLDDLSLYGGVLGFNSVQLKGNMNLVGGTRLKLGVTDEAGWTKITKQSSSAMTGYERVLTSETVTIGSGKTLTVITSSTTEAKIEDIEMEVPTTAVVQGNLVLEDGASLTFRTNDLLPFALPVSERTGNHEIVPLLEVTGSLTIQNRDTLTIALTGSNFSMEDFNNKKYYLAAADEINVSYVDASGSKVSGGETLFGSRTISLGYGYFGTLYMVGDGGSSLEEDTDSSNARDYLVMSITGDPRRTWSGNVAQVEKHEANLENPRDAHVWYGTGADAVDGTDYRWKENRPFLEGHVVLFGNLYEPAEWEKTAYLNSEQTVNVKADVLNDGTTVASVKDEYDFRIDGHDLTQSYSEKQQQQAEELGISLDYQAVRVEGLVAPFSIIINSEYYKYGKDAEDKYTVLQLNDEGGILHSDNTNYYFYSVGDPILNAEGEEVSETNGSITDADPRVLENRGFDGAWKTMLHKTGTGTTVMALDNSYSGGTILQGQGRMVMQHRNALGTGTITMLDGAMLHGDFEDEDVSGGAYLGKAMATTTIHNHVVVNVYADPDDANYNAAIDGRLVNSYNKKLVLTTLAGESDTVLELNGVGLSAKQSQELYGRDDMYRYGVFKVLDPHEFYGSITMRGHEYGAALSDTKPAGRVQLDIMSTTKSDDGADWTNATVDLSVQDGTERTVLALDATGEVDPEKKYEWCVLNNITGTYITEGGSSSVLNISAHNPITLVLTGSRSGHYHGVMGYGDFQVAVNYGGYAEELQGTTQHHYGAKGWGSLNLIKQGAGTVQRVRRAWLNEVKVKGGDFHVEEALVASSLTSGGGKRIMVGNPDLSSLYGLTVGDGGVLAMNTEFNVAGTKTDAFANISAGTTDGDSTKDAGWVLLDDGATLSAREDWYTRKQVDIAEDAHVTINTHNFTIDPYILSTECDDAEFLEKREISHIIQLLGTFSGRDVTLTLNNWKTAPEGTTPDEELRDEVSRDIGYVALNDLNDFTGSSKVRVEDMTVLQILNNNGGKQADVDITVEGKHATLQITDHVISYENSDLPEISNTMVQYIDNLKLGAYDSSLNEGLEQDPYHQINNGQLVLGGEEQTTLKGSDDSRLTSPDLAGMQVLVTSRHTNEALQGEVNYMNVDMRGDAVKMGGSDSRRAELVNTHVDMETRQTAHEIHHTNIKNSLLHLQAQCSVSLADTVMVDADSTVRSVCADPSVLTPDDPFIIRDGHGSYVAGGPTIAIPEGSTAMVTEVDTSVTTVVHMTFAQFEGNNPSSNVYQAGDTRILVLQTNQFQGVDVSGNGLTIQLEVDNWLSLSQQTRSSYIAIQMGGGCGFFEYEVDNTQFAQMIDSQFVLRDSNGNQLTNMWVSAAQVSADTGHEVSPYMLYFAVIVPEPATTTLSLLALTTLLARRRRKA